MHARTTYDTGEGGSNSSPSHIFLSDSTEHQVDVVNFFVNLFSVVIMMTLAIRMMIDIVMTSLFCCVSRMINNH